MSTLRFDGIDFPDGAASEPGALGWMQGSPPPPDRRIRFRNGRFLEFPQIRWALSHLRELMPTASVARGSGAARDLGDAVDVQAEIDQLRFDSLDGQRCHWGQSLPDTYTDGIVVLYRGRVVYERYFGALKPQLPHACFSITKSYAATLAATLMYEGVLEDSRTVPYYLPEMAGSAYADATLRDLLDMQVGVAHSEVYSDPSTQFWVYARAAGFCPRPPDDSGPDGLHEYLVTLRRDG